VSSSTKRVTHIVFLTIFLDLAGFGIVIPLLPVYVKSMGGSAQAVGFILAAFSLTQLIATPVLGRMSDRLGRRPVILTSLAGNAASMVIYAFATEMRLLPLLLISRIIAGATAGNIATCQAAVADVTEGAERAKAMGRVGAAIGLGIVMGPAMGSALSVFGAWAPPLASALLALIDLVAAFFALPETRGPSSPPSVRPESPAWREAFADRRLLTILSFNFFMFVGATNLQVAMPLLAIDRFGWSQGQIGLLFTGFGAISFFVQGGLIGRLLRVTSPTTVVANGGALMALGLVLMGLATTSPVLVAGLSSFALGMGATQPVITTMAAEAAGESRRGAILGVAQSCGGLGRTVGPVWAGLLFKAVGASAPFVSGAAFCGLLASLALTLRGTAARAR
jgi:MFS family permease